MTRFTLKTSLMIDGVLINIEIEEGTSGLFFATSPEVRGLMVSGHSKEECIAKVPFALIDLKAAQK